MSGMAGNVTAFNTVWTYDIYQNYIARNRSDRHYLNVGRAVTAVGIVISIATAYSARAFPNIFDYWALLSSIFVGAPFATFVLGISTRRVGGTAAFFGMLCGILATIIHYCLYVYGFLHYGSVLAMDFYGAAYGFFANIAVALLVSVFRPLDTRSFSLKSETQNDAQASAPWYCTPQALACFSLVLVIILNLVYW
jgi:SSS family solute:Na+ symporter